MENRRKIRIAFSLVELLSVMAVISLVAALTAPALRGVLDGVALTGAVELVGAELSSARQTAMSRNLPVEVRIHQKDGPFGERWSVISAVVPREPESGRESDEWLSPGKALPGNLVFSDAGEFSTLLSPGIGGRWPVAATAGSDAPAMLRGTNYVAFRFCPDGSTNLPKGSSWCLSMRSAVAHGVDGKPSDNYASIVVDSVTGRHMVFRP